MIAHDHQQHHLHHHHTPPPVTTFVGWSINICTISPISIILNNSPRWLTETNVNERSSDQPTDRSYSLILDNYKRCCCWLFALLLHLRMRSTSPAQSNNPPPINNTIFFGLDCNKQTAKTFGIKIRSIQMWFSEKETCSTTKWQRINYICEKV